MNSMFETRPPARHAIAIPSTVAPRVRSIEIGTARAGRQWSARSQRFDAANCDESVKAVYRAARREMAAWRR